MARRANRRISGNSVSDQLVEMPGQTAFYKTKLTVWNSETFCKDVKRKGNFGSLQGHHIGETARNSIPKLNMSKSQR